MAGGFKSPAFWLGLSGGTGAQGGFRTPIPGWNAGAVSSVAQGGYRSLLGYWVGGVAASAVAPRPGPQPGGGDSRKEWLRLRGQIIREDSEFIEILAALIENEIIH